MARLIIHAGLGKTGTTALQTWLSRAQGLAARGILHAGIELQGLPGRMRLPGQGAVGDPGLLARGLEKIEAAAARPEVDAIVWSNESIGMSHNRAGIAAALDAFLAGSAHVDALEIVLVLRRQDEWIESAYRQWGLRHKMRKGYGVPTPRQYLAGAQGLLDYRGLWRLWSRVGGAAVRVISYDDVMAGGGMAPVFAREVLGIDAADHPVPGGPADGRVHVSPGPALSYFHALYNAGRPGPVPPEEFGALIEACALPELAPPGAAFFGKAIRREILRRHAADNDALAQEALGRPHLFADRPVADVARYTEGPQHALTYFALIAARQDQRGARAALRNAFAPPE
ncbi:hypothetical protein ACQ5SO_05730 [Rhodovulum sp. DZ06]|uniref:hypothetical protein n=1 Tax=Rhodovulum sp. DZ06 TaxID=3425126 RepID=UPI003D3294B8